MLDLDHHLAIVEWVSLLIELKSFHGEVQIQLRQFAPDGIAGRI